MTATDAEARARALLANITPGEWRTHSPRTIAPGYVTSYTSIHAQGGYLPVASIPGLRFGEAASEDEPTIIARKTANAAFISAAPALVRDLLATIDARDAEIARLRAEVERLKEPEELFWCSRCGRSTSTSDGDGRLCNWCINECEGSNR